MSKNAKQMKRLRMTGLDRQDATITAGGVRRSSRLVVFDTDGKEFGGRSRSGSRCSPARPIVRLPEFGGCATLFTVHEPVPRPQACLLAANSESTSPSRRQPTESRLTNC
jgi:hypothetical protein